MIPPGQRLYTAEQRHLDVIEHAARDRETELVVIGSDEIAAISPEDLAGFSYTEHPDNLALALRICADQGVDRRVALAGMQKARPDPGALREYALEVDGRRLVFVNAFAANDPVSSEQLWKMALARHTDCIDRIALFNCRADRPDRSIHLASELPRWLPATRVLVVGNGTHLFAKAAIQSGFDREKLELCEGFDESAIFERVRAIIDSSALVVGMGNIGGVGLSVVRLFAERRIERAA
jgi:poly-gamma-glutamate synthase PgsB/CapB